MNLDLYIEIKEKEKNKFKNLIKKKNNSIIPIIFILLVFISLIVSINSDFPLEAGTVFLITLLFIFAGILVLKKSFNSINSLFSLSLFIYAFATFFGFLGYWRIEFSEYWIFSTFFLLIAPLGIYTSGKLIIYGRESILNAETIYIWLIMIFLSLFGLLIYDSTQKSILNVVYPDILNILLILLTISFFEKIRLSSSDIISQINLLIGGLLLVILGLGGNLAFLVLFGNSTVLRYILPTLGMIFITYSFIKISDKEINISLNKSKRKIKDTVNEIEKAVKNLSENLNPNKLLSSGDQGSTNLSLGVEKEKEFQKDLIEEMNGFTIAILIESALSYPKPIFNRKIQQIFKKNKATVTYQFRKLESLGYLRQIVNLKDTRIKPSVITEKGALFLYHINKNLNVYLKSEMGISLITLGIIE